MNSTGIKLVYKKGIKEAQTELSYDYIIRLFKPYDKRKNIRCNGLDSLRSIRYNSS